jgi:hypothetical protein
MRLILFSGVSVDGSNAAFEDVTDVKIFVVRVDL